MKLSVRKLRHKETINVFMKQRSVVVLALIAVCILGMSSMPSGAFASVLTANFDSANNNSLSAPYVGTATINYTGTLPNGPISFSDLVNTYNGTLSIVFPAGGSAGIWTGADLVSNSNQVQVYVVGSSFLFTSSVSNGVSSNTVVNGSADFVNSSSMIFTAEPINNNLFSDYRSSSFTYPMYQILDRPGGNPYYFGDYGVSRSNAVASTAVPEPSTYALLCISLGVVGFARKKMGKSEA